MPKSGSAAEGPEPGTLRSYADGFRGLASRIADAKSQINDTYILREEMCFTYPAEAGRLFCICMEDDAFIDIVPYVRDIREWQYEPTIERLPAGGIVVQRDDHKQTIALDLRAIAELLGLARKTEEVSESELPSKDRELRCLYAVIWFRIIRGWLHKVAPARFRPDLTKKFHYWVDVYPASRLIGQAGRDAGISTKAASALAESTEYLIIQSKERTMPVLLAHADIQSAACILVADRLEREARVIAEYAGPNTEAPNSAKTADNAPTAPGPSESMTKHGGRLRWLATAMLLVQEHPDWSDNQIAKQVGKNRSTLARSKEYQAAAAMARGGRDRIARGFIARDSETGHTDVDAYADEEDSDPN